jgi:NADPH-dependent 2,4-dienoyl-CoA reductase/sulfur reductase-like enzyme/rhodanese-related sulfurtransferase
MKKKVIIVGGVAGGASAAARLRRLDEKAQIILLERGPYISYANCGLPYFIGDVILKKENLFVVTPSLFSNRFRVDVRINHEVIKINRTRKEVEIVDRTKNITYTEDYNILVLSPGAEPIRPPIEGVHSEGVFTLRTVNDAENIKEFITTRKVQSASIIGAGAIGIEVAENLNLKGIKLTLIDMLNQVLPFLDPEMSYYVIEHLKDKNIEVLLGRKLLKITKNNNGNGLKLTLDSGEEITCDMALLSIGIKPEVKLAKEAGLEIGPHGGIKVNEYLQTSDPFIYAIGDAIEVKDFITGEETIIPLAGPANRQGRIVADNICGRKVPYRGTLPTVILKVFDLTVAATGANEKTLKAKNIPYEKIYLHPFDHATYYPGATQMHIKLLFNPNNGNILGAQIIGKNGVDKRIDVLATSIRGKMTVFDLQYLDLAYSPPYGSGKDVINMIGFVATNVLENLVKITHWDSVKESDLLLDVRSPVEVAANPVKGAINIPLDDLRNRLKDLPKDKPIKVFCEVGSRSYIACRILTQNGFEAYNLSGGYLTYKAFKGVKG